MSTATTTRATIDDLLAVEGKAELISGRIVNLMGTGHRPNRVAGKISRSLDDWAEAIGRGVVYTSNIIFALTELSSGPESFNPDASYYVCPIPGDEMKPIAGPPTLAVEVRSQSDYGTAADRAIIQKRADDFEAGTEVVWDVDTIEERIHVYRRNQPALATTYVRDLVAESEPAVPGWRPLVDNHFPAT